MSRSKIAFLHLNIPFLETPYYLNTWKKITMHMLASASTFLLVLPRCHVQMLPSDSETDIIYKLIQMSDMKSLTPTGMEGAAWIKVLLEPDSVQLCPIYCDAHRSLWKQHANLDFPLLYERGLLSTFWELWTGLSCGCILGFSLTSLSRCLFVLCICFLWVVRHICTAGALMQG